MDHSLAVIIAVLIQLHEKTNQPIQQIHNDIPKEDTVYPMKGSYFEKLVDAKQIKNHDFANGTDLCSFNLNQISLNPQFNLTTIGGKHCENIGLGYTVCSLYKLLSLSKNHEELSVGFDMNRAKRVTELMNKACIGIFSCSQEFPRVFFGFAEHQDTLI